MKNEKPESLAAKLSRQICEGRWLRLTMSLILSAVTASGVLISKLLLTMGFKPVIIRYPLAVCGAYGVFLLLIRLWIWYVSPERRAQSSWWNWSSSDSQPSTSSSSSGVIGSGDWDFGSGGGRSSGGGFGGGSSGGAGASSSWEANPMVAMPMPSRGSGGGRGSSSWFSGSSSGGSSSGGSGGGDDLGDAIWVVILLGALVAVIFGGAVYVIYIAPELMPEVAVNAILASGLSKSYKQMQAGDWMDSVFKKTWIPFALVLLVSAGLGFAVHYTCPTAVKLMDAFGNCRS